LPNAVLVSYTVNGIYTDRKIGEGNKKYTLMKLFDSTQKSTHHSEKIIPEK
jgi:hypothetical protein